MSAQTAENTNRLLSTVSYAALFSACVAGIFTGHAVDEGLTAGGFGLAGHVMAAAAALAMTACYGSFLHIAIKGIAPLEPEERAKSRGLIAAGTVLLALGSAYPNVIVSGGSLAAAIEDRHYIATVAEAGDQLKAAARSAEQIETMVVAAKGKIDTLAAVEGNGGLSGSPSLGGLSGLISARGQALDRAIEALATPKEKVAEEIDLIDRATDKMRAAVIQKDTGPDERRRLMQRHGDEARSAAINVAALTPVAALDALANDLMGPQIEPKYSTRPEIRANQEDGFRKYKEELRRLGKAIAQKSSDLSEALKVKVPVYDPPPPSILVLRHADALTNTIALALTLDGLPLMLYFAAAAIHDAARRRAEKAKREAITEVTKDVDLGVHPHESATRARGGDSTRRNGRDASDRSASQ